VNVNVDATASWVKTSQSIVMRGESVNLEYIGTGDVTVLEQIVHRAQKSVHRRLSSSLRLSMSLSIAVLSPGPIALKI
jgi:hypothetical protein